MKQKDGGKTIFRKIVIASVIAIVIIVTAVLAYIIGRPIYDYNKGMTAFEAGQYENAIMYFEKTEYKDSKLMADLSYFENGKVFYNNNNYKEALDNFLMVEDVEDRDAWLEKTGVELLNSQQYDDALTAFNAIPNMQDDSAKWYAYAMKAFNEKEYDSAIENFEKCIEPRDVSEKILEAYYLRGKESFENGRYQSAKEDFEKCVSYSDSTVQIENCIFKIAENYWSKKDYENAKGFYVQLPSDFAYGNVRVENRLSSINIYDSVKHLEGSYSVKKGDYRVTQTHNSTGIYHYWYNTEPGYGSLEISVTVNDDGSVTISGRAEGTRYTSYSSIASGVKTGSYYANFSRDIKSGGLSAGTLYSDENIILKYAGGRTFTLSYNKVDRSQDVYFRYTYISNYTFEK